VLISEYHHFRFFTQFIFWKINGRKEEGRRREIRVREIRVREIPSKLLISSGGINFVTPAANFCDHLPCLFHQILKKFKNKLSFK